MLQGGVQGMSQAPLDMIKVISSKKIDHVRIELDQIKWMEKNILTLCKRFLDVWSFFSKESTPWTNRGTNRGQTYWVRGTVY